MTIVSIDFSVLYPGVCICKNFKEFKWLAIVNTDIRKKDQANIDILNSEYPNLSIFSTISRRKKDQQYHITERNKLANYLELVNLLISKIKEEVGEDELIVCLEGQSFSSGGNSLIDISQATGILKDHIVLNLLNNSVDRLFIFSPSELKNAIGCKGNANKLEIFSAFIKDPIIQEVKESDLYKLVTKEEWILEKEKVVSPVIDMIDSYLGVLKIHSFLK
jgi:hypothetical protein